MGSLWGFLKLAGAFWGSLGFLWPPWYLPGLPGALCGSFGLSNAFRCCLEFSTTVRGFLGLSRATSELAGLQWASLGPCQRAPRASGHAPARSERASERLVRAGAYRGAFGARQRAGARRGAPWMRLGAPRAGRGARGAPAIVLCEQARTGTPSGLPMGAACERARAGAPSGRAERRRVRGSAACERARARAPSGRTRERRARAGTRRCVIRCLREARKRRVRVGTLQGRFGAHRVATRKSGYARERLRGAPGSAACERACAWRGG